MSKVVGIYKITSPSGRVYIGQSWNIKHRWQDYGKSTTKSQPYLNHSFLKHGKKAHSFEVIHELPYDVQQQTLDVYEQLYMYLYRQCGAKLMNIREAGSQGKLSEETKQKVSQSLKGNKPWNAGLKGAYKPTEETKRLISKANKGRPAHNKGKQMPAESIMIACIKKRGQKRTPEQLERIREARKRIGPQMGGFKNKGRIRTEEHKRNLGASLRRSGKGRGEKHNMAKLTGAQVLEIRSKFIPRIYSARKLSKEYGVAKTTILDIINRKIWVHI